MPQRIISVVPAATEILYAIGAAQQVAAVSSFDRYPPEVARLPRVGALLDPDLERIITLRPDLVILYATQVELRTRLDRLGIPAFEYRHGNLHDVLTTIQAIGDRVGRAGEALRLTSRLRQRLDAVRASVKDDPRPSTLLVFERDHASLRGIYASAGFGFLNDMLELAGGRNVYGGVQRESLQVTSEMILAAAPEVILEVRPGRPLTEDELTREIASWNVLPAVPAVRDSRVRLLVGDEFVVAGPRIADAVERMADALHPGRRSRSR